MKSEERFYFDTDSSMHWYLLPISSRKEWEKMFVDDPDDDDTKFLNSFEKKYSKYRIGTHPKRYSFKEPSLEK